MNRARTSRTAIAAPSRPRPRRAGRPPGGRSRPVSTRALVGRSPLPTPTSSRQPPDGPQRASGPFGVDQVRARSRRPHPPVGRAKRPAAEDEGGGHARSHTEVDEILRDPAGAHDGPTAPSAAAFTSFSTNAGHAGGGCQLRADRRQASPSTPRFTACRTVRGRGRPRPGIPTPTASKPSPPTHPAQARLKHVEGGPPPTASPPLVVRSPPVTSPTTHPRGCETDGPASFCYRRHRCPRASVDGLMTLWSIRRRPSPGRTGGPGRRRLSLALIGVGPRSRVLRGGRSGR